MKTITMTAIICAALATGPVATIASSTVSRALTGPEDLSPMALAQPEMPTHPLEARR